MVPVSSRDDGMDREDVSVTRIGFNGGLVPSPYENTLEVPKPAVWVCQLGPLTSPQRL